VIIVDLTSSCLPLLLCRGEAELSGSWVKFLVLGLALLFLGKQETVEPTLEVGRPCTGCVGPNGLVVVAHIKAC
jgi:hypothetical protein